MENDNYRHEYKYLISYGQLKMLQNRLNRLMPVDPHCGPDGMYNISSLYFDDYYNSGFYDNLSGADPREKYRIRIYNHSDERISLECKRKENGKTLKKACVISKDQCETMMRGGVIPITAETPKVLKATMLKVLNQGLHPVVIVEYDRIPYVYRNGNVRVTLDMNMSSSSYTQDFLDNKAPKRPIMEKGNHLLEVKFDEYIPDFIFRALQLDNLEQTAYSKYFLCRKYSL